MSIGFPKPPRTPRKARKPLPPSSSRPPRKAPPRPKKRKPSEYARIYGSKARVEWMKAQECHVCWSRAAVGHHITVEGMSRKAGYDQIIPLCHLHHDEIHKGAESFARHHGINLTLSAKLVQERWLAFSGGAENEEETA